MGLRTTLAEKIGRALESRVADIYTNMVGKVVTYYPESQTADIQPVIRRRIAKENGEPVQEDLPMIPNVPILFPRSGLVGIVFDLQAGDHVALLVLTAAITAWRQSGDTADAADVRLHHPGNCLALPGLGPSSGPMTFYESGNLVLECPQFIVLGAGASEFAAVASKVQADLDAIKLAYDAHTHEVAAFGTSDPPPAPISLSNDVASSNVKLKG